MSSIKEVAKEIVSEWADAHQVTEVGPGTKARLVTAVEQALRAERERAAKVVNNARSEGADLRELVARIRDENYEVEP